jgi:hypothetical protein
MSGDIPPLPQYSFTVWCSVKAQGQVYLLPLPSSICIACTAYLTLLDLTTIIMCVNVLKVSTAPCERISCLIKHHTMKTYGGGSGVAAPHNRWM